MAQTSPQRTLNRLGLELPLEVRSLIASFVLVAPPHSFFPPAITASWDDEHERTLLGHPTLKLVTGPEKDNGVKMRRDARRGALQRLSKVDERWKAACEHLLKKKALNLSPRRKVRQSRPPVSQDRRQRAQILEATRLKGKLSHVAEYHNLVALSLDKAVSVFLPRILLALPGGPVQLLELRFDCSSPRFKHHHPWITLSKCTGLRVVEIQSLCKPWTIYDDLCIPEDDQYFGLASYDSDMDDPWFEEKAAAEWLFWHWSCRRGLPVFYALSKMRQLEDLTLAHFYLNDFEEPSIMGTTIYDEDPLIDKRTPSEKEEDPLERVRAFVDLEWRAPLRRLALFNVEDFYGQDVVRFIRMFSSTLEILITEEVDFTPMHLADSIFAPLNDSTHPKYDPAAPSPRDDLQFSQLKCVTVTHTTSSHPGHGPLSATVLVSDVLEKAPKLIKIALKGYRASEEMCAYFTPVKAGNQLLEVDLALSRGEELEEDDHPELSVAILRARFRAFSFAFQERAVLNELGALGYEMGKVSQEGGESQQEEGASLGGEFPVMRYSIKYL